MEVSIMDTTLKNVLPSGSGIDYEWEISHISADSIVAKNGWHYMSQNGYYMGCIDFDIEIYKDGHFDYPKMVDVEVFSKTELARDIAIDALEKEEVTEDEIIDVAISELQCLADIIHSCFESVNSVELGKAVSDYIEEECRISIDVPGFWGFYCSSYTENTDLEYFFFNDYDCLDDKTKALYREFMDRKADYSFDSDFINNVCRIYVEKFDERVRDVIKSWESSEFEMCSMPKYYNFECDRCFAKVLITDDVEEEIMDYLEAHHQEWEQYIRRRFTSGDGFFSNYSNNIEDWQMPIRKMDWNELAAVIDFILRSEDVDYNDINCQTYEELSGQGLDYDFYIVNKNQAALNEFIIENGGSLED